MPRIVRHAGVVWEGNTARGAGELGVESEALAGVPYSLASRLGPEPGKTSPEELLAAAHGACFAMSLATELTKNGTPPGRLDVRATVVMDEVGDRGHLVVSSELDVTAAVDGIDAATLERIVAEADAGCPLAILIRGSASVTVRAQLQSS